MLRRTLLAFFALIISALIGCAALAPQPKTIHISQERLMQLVGKEFPFKSQLLDALDVSVSSPKISLDTNNNRINTALDLSVGGSGILGAVTKREYKGGIDLSYGLRFEPSDNSVRMTDVKVGKISVDGAPELMERPISRLGVALAQKLLADQVLYKVSDKDMEAAQGWGYKPGAFKIGAAGLAITLDPIEKK
jgi:hypothetical protein